MFLFFLALLSLSITFMEHNHITTSSSAWCLYSSTLLNEVSKPPHQVAIQAGQLAGTLHLSQNLEIYGEGQPKTGAWMCMVVGLSRLEPQR